MRPLRESRKGRRRRGRRERDREEDPLVTLGGGGTAKVGNDHTGIYTFRDSRSLPSLLRFPFPLPRAHTHDDDPPRRAWPGRASIRRDAPSILESIRAGEFMREILVSEARRFQDRSNQPIIRKSRVFVIGIVTPPPLERVQECPSLPPSLSRNSPLPSPLPPPPFSTNFLYSYLRARHNRLDGGRKTFGRRNSGTVPRKGIREKGM